MQKKSYDAGDPYPLFEQDANTLYHKLAYPVLKRAGWKPNIAHPCRSYVCEDRDKGDVWYKDAHWQLIHSRYGQLSVSIWGEDIHRDENGVPSLWELHFNLECLNERSVEFSIYVNSGGNWIYALKGVYQLLAKAPPRKEK